MVQTRAGLELTSVGEPVAESDGAACHEQDNRELHDSIGERVNGMEEIV